MDPAILDEAVARINTGQGAGVIIKDGYLIKSWGDTSARIDWASAGKSVLSTMLLFALNEQRISSIHDPIRDWGWVDAGDAALELQGKDLEISFYHLANMTSGFDRVEGPGEAYAYNDNAVQLYARTLLRVFDAETPQTAFNDAATRESRLGALRFQDGSVFGTTDPRQRDRAETATFTSPRDLARVGWFWLNRGYWDGQQLLPERYFDAFQRSLVPNDMPLSVAGREKYLLIGSWGNRYTFDAPYGPGIYGLHWWFNGLVGTSSRRHWPDAPLDAYAAIGNYPTRAIVVMPGLGLVVVAHGDWSAGTHDASPLEGSRGQPHRYWNPGQADAALNQQLKLFVDAARP